LFNDVSAIRRSTPFDLRSGQAVERFVCEIRPQRALDRCARLNRESGLERADAGARGGDSASGSFCSGISCVKKRNPEIKRLMHERNHLEGIAEIYRKFLHVSIAYIMIDSCMQQFMVAGRW
jgi:hypothetical protein